MFDGQIELEFRSVAFCGVMKPEENPLRKEKTNNKLNPHETLSVGSELGSQVRGELSFTAQPALPISIVGPSYITHYVHLHCTWS